MVAAVAILALAAGMTSIGGAPFVAEIKKQLIGEREMVKVNSEREGEDARVSTESSESEFYQKVKEVFRFTPVRLGFVPINTKMIDYEVNKDLEEACMILECEGKIIEYQIWSNFKDKSIGYDIEDNLISEKIINISGNDIVLRSYDNKDTGEKEYIAQFEYKGECYILNGYVQKEEFTKIINNLIF